MQKEIEEIEEIEIITTEEDIDKNDPAYFENNKNNENNENREFYVYEHIRLDNMTCFYVGKGKGERAYDLVRNNHHDRISNRHGHAVVIIKDNLTEEEAFELERDTIEDYVFNLGYGIDIIGFNNKEDNEIGYLTNCTWGGEGVSGANKGKQLSEEHKKNISEARKGKQFSEEHKKKIGESMKGKNNPMYGKKFSEKTRKKLSEAHKGKNAGENHPLYGKHHSEETKRKMSEKLSKKVICITTGKIFNSFKEASNYYNVVKSSISKCCIGTRKSAGKLNGTRLKWKFLENYDNEFKGILINPIIDKID